jgi:hypothetical protein
MRGFSMLWALPLFLAGCGDKSAVSLSANITQGSVKVENGVLGATASGSFDMLFALGPEAPGPRSVRPQNFQLLAQDKTVLADQLPIASPSSAAITIAKGESKTVHFTFESIAVDHDQACAGTVSITGSVEDETGSGSQLVASGPVTPSCD